MTDRRESLCTFDAVPFIIGSASTPHNPVGIPDVLPLALHIDLTTGLIRQSNSEIVSRFLDVAYKSGSLLGTAMDDTLLGKSYAEDFLGCLASAVDLRGRSVLEIGAGRGFFLQLLQRAGAQALGIEPGRDNAHFWKAKGVTVINDFFPGPLRYEKFDVVTGFAVLEHVEDVQLFLASVRNHLVDNGLAVFAVPDCELYVADGDPGMLLHEHWSYFTASTLRNVFALAGFDVREVRRASYGGLLYIIASRGQARSAVSISQSDFEAAKSFGVKCRQLRKSLKLRIAQLSEEGGSLGIFAPARALMWIEPNVRVRFFDDDPALHLRYYPPFEAAIENRNDLIRRPVDELWIMSKSFGLKIERELSTYPSLQSTRIVLVADLLRQFSSI